MKKLFLLFLILFLIVPAVSAKDKTKAVANIAMDFSKENIPDKISFYLTEDIEDDDGFIIPKNSYVTAKIIQVQKALRWHKSGFILSKIESFKPISSYDKIDVLNRDIYIVAKKYEKVYAKEATILGTEIVLSQGASFFAPGVDILYFFTKGAIKKRTHPHWFMAGVSYAYENSICWFWLKGKPIELDIDDAIQIKEVDEKKAVKISKKVEKRHLKEAKKQEKKELKNKKKELKEEKKRLKQEMKKQRLLGV